MSEPLEIQRLPRSLHEILILATLREGAKHGYQIALDVERRSGGAFAVSHGTLYPILHELEEEGRIDGTWSREGGRRRKEYAISDAGRRHLAKRTESWEALHRHLARFIASAAA